NHTSFAIDAKNNWWGVDDSAEINAGTNPQALSFIYDGNNDGNAGKVNYAGWLSFSIQDQTPPLTTLSNTSIISSLSFEITLSCNDDIGGVSSGCTATYYTIDNSEPTTGSVLYEGAITLNESAVVKFFSIDVAGHKEAVTTKRFYIDDIDAQNASRSGELLISGQETSQSFLAEISEPIILLSAPSYKDSGSGVAKVSSVTSTEVTASFKEWEYLDGNHDAESVPYVALTKGRYLLSNGDELEVGELQLSSTQQWQETTFESSFAASPTVILTSQSNETSKVFNLLADNITSSGFSAKLAEQESNTVGEYAEKVGYLAYYKNELEPVEQSEPFVVSSNIEVSSDWSAVDSFAISLQEEASFDEELVHTSEFISMVNINGTILFQQIGELESDTSSLRRSIVDTDLDTLLDVFDTDDDNDGVIDLNDAFSTNAAASVDTDLDGLPDSFHESCDDACIVSSGLTLDLDDDNDGYSDIDELANETDSLSGDSIPSDNDGDFISDILDTDDDNDLVLDVDDAFPLDATESLDTDGDSIGNNADTDDDNDGIIDEDDSAPLDDSIGDNVSPVFSELVDVTFEATGTTTDLELVVPEVTDNNLNAPTVVSDYSDALPLGTHEVTWTATDFAGNVKAAVQLVHIVDTTAAMFDDLQIQTLSAMGILSDVSDEINNVQAYDLVDGNINAVVIGDTLYRSGAHFVPVSATDSSGNIAETEVEVHINPLVELSQSRKVEPGATVVLPVTLSGNAAVYPVGVTYTLMQSGSIIATNELTISENISGVITIEIPSDALNGDVYSVAITSAKNAVLGFVTSIQLTVDQTNFTPTLILVTQQNDEKISVVDGQGGIVTVTAFVHDINVNDIHDITWSSLNNTLVDLNTDSLMSTFEFSPEGLTSNTYELTVNVSENNTSELYSISVDKNIVVDASLPPLDINTDSDNDGISDADEGYSDSDNDGISDYLDTDDNPSRLPIDDSTAAMQTLNGLSLSLGDIVTMSGGATAANATVNVNDITSDEHFTTLSTITNFNVSGLTEAGQSVPIVIPLANGKTILEGSIYRKHSNSKGWFDFVVDSNNGVYSASTDEDGNCPYPLSTQYQQGLTAGNNCIQLLIKDGGENDADGLANGMVKDPGALTSQFTNQAPVIVVNTDETANEGSVVTFDASATNDAENDALTYLWVQLTGPTVELSGQDTATLSFTAPQVGNDEFLTFELTVNDGQDTSATEVNVLVLQVNVAPMVSIDSHASSYDEGTTILLTATGADEDNDVLNYQWEQTVGPAVTLSGASSASVTFTAPAVSSDQSFEFKVTVSDGIDAISKTTTVTVKNVATVTPSVTPPKESGGGGGSMSWVLVLLVFSLFRGRHLKQAA
ncbi:PKD domain-containing protein, partial [Colwellia sp. BRX10-2]